METETRLKRTAKNIEFQINLLNKLKMSFEVQNGTYTTTIITKNGKTRYMMNTYPTRVFQVANMIKRDVLKSENAQKIIEAKYFKSNFGFSELSKSYKAKQVLNIDITSAYATCLVQNKLITEKTYEALKKLPKKDRLPCVGMLATSHTKYFYENGECTNVDTFRSHTAPVFFYVIDEINYIMQNIQFLLGDKYIFHWVDGIFFDFKTDKKTISLIEDFLTQQGYQYKYEDVQNFKVEADEKKMILKMIKNGSPKQYTIGKDNVGKELNRYLSSLIKQQEKTPETNIEK